MTQENVRLLRGVIADLSLLPDGTLRGNILFSGVEVPVEGRVSTENLPKILATLDAGEKEKARRIFGDGLWADWPFDLLYDESVAREVAKANTVAFGGEYWHIYGRIKGALQYIGYASRECEKRLIRHMAKLGVLREVARGLLVPTSEIGELVLRELSHIPQQRAVSLYTTTRTAEEFRCKALSWLL